MTIPDTIVPNFSYPRIGRIVNISNSPNGVLTFASPHSYTIGEILALRVSPEFRMIELNNQEVRVISTTSLTATIETDTSTFIPFFNAGSNVRIPCFAVPSSSGVVPSAYPSQTNLADAFDNVPP